MSIFDDTRHWIKDRLTSDEYIQGTPEQKMRELESIMPDLTNELRIEKVNHVHSYLEYYYGNHQQEAIPDESKKQMNELIFSIDRHRKLDHAREVLESFGGPPTEKTLVQALERSEQERERIRESNKPAESLERQTVTGNTESARVKINAEDAPSFRETFDGKEPPKETEKESTGYRVRQVVG